MHSRNRFRREICLQRTVQKESTSTSIAKLQYVQQQPPWRTPLECFAPHATGPLRPWATSLHISSTRKTASAKLPLTRSSHQHPNAQLLLLLLLPLLLQCCPQRRLQTSDHVQVHRVIWTTPPRMSWKQSFWRMLLPEPKFLREQPRNPV